MKDALKKVHKDWALNLQVSVSQMFEFTRTHEQRVGALAVHNFTDVLRYLPSTHHALGTLFETAPDYFGMSELNQDEFRVYAVLADLLEAWIVDPPTTRQKDILSYVRGEALPKGAG